MQKENLSFAEAVQALVDNKCKGIGRPSFVKNSDGIQAYIELRGMYSKDLKWNHSTTQLNAHTEHILANDWQLVDPKIKVELEGKVTGDTCNGFKVGNDHLDTVLENKGFVNTNVKLTIETI